MVPGVVVSYLPTPVLFQPAMGVALSNFGIFFFFEGVGLGLVFPGGMSGFVSPSV